MHVDLCIVILISINAMSHKALRDMALIDISMMYNPRHNVFLSTFINFYYLCFVSFQAMLNV